MTDKEKPQELEPGTYKIDLRKLVFSMIRMLKSGILLFRIEPKD